MNSNHHAFKEIFLPVNRCTQEEYNRLLQIDGEPSIDMDIAEDSESSDIYTVEDCAMIRCITRKDGCYRILRHAILPTNGQLPKEEIYDELIIVLSNNQGSQQKSHLASCDFFKYLTQMENCFASIPQSRLAVYYRHRSFPGGTINVPICGFESQPFAEVIIAALRFVKDAIIGEISFDDETNYNLAPLDRETMRKYISLKLNLWLIPSPCISFGKDGTMYIESVNFRLECINVDNFPADYSYWDKVDWVQERAHNEVPSWLANFIASFNASLPRLLNDKVEFIKLRDVYTAYLYASMNSKYEDMSAPDSQKFPIGESLFRSLPPLNFSQFDINVGILFLHNGDHECNLFKPSRFSRTCETILGTATAYEDKILIPTVTAAASKLLIEVFHEQATHDVTSLLHRMRVHFEGGSSLQSEDIQRYMLHRSSLHMNGIRIRDEQSNKFELIRFLNSIPCDDEINQRLDHTFVHFGYPTNDNLVIGWFKETLNKYSNFDVARANLNNCDFNVRTKDFVSHLANWKTILDALENSPDSLSRVYGHFTDTHAPSVEARDEMEASIEDDRTALDDQPTNQASSRSKRRSHGNKSPSSSVKPRKRQSFLSDVLSQHERIGFVIKAADSWMKQLLMNRFQSFPGLFQNHHKCFRLLPSGRFYYDDKYNIFHAREFGLQIVFVHPDVVSFGNEIPPTPKHIQDALDLVNENLIGRIWKVPELIALREVYIAYMCILLQSSSQHRSSLSSLQPNTWSTGIAVHIPAHNHDRRNRYLDSRINYFLNREIQESGASIESAMIKVPAFATANQSIEPTLLPTIPPTNYVMPRASQLPSTDAISSNIDELVHTMASIYLSTRSRFISGATSSSSKSSQSIDEGSPVSLATAASSIEGSTINQTVNSESSEQERAKLTFEANIFRQLFDRINQECDSQLTNDRNTCIFPLLLILSRMLTEIIQIGTTSIGVQLQGKSSPSSRWDDDCFCTNQPILPNNPSFSNPKSSLSQEIFEFMTNVQQRTNVDLMCNLMAFVYIVRLQAYHPTATITPRNYEMIWLTAIIIAQKSFKKNFKPTSEVRSHFLVSISQLRACEDHFLKSIEKDIRIDHNLYSHFYKILEISENLVLAIRSERKSREKLVKDR
jgi:hypothetical protein